MYDHFNHITREDMPLTQKSSLYPT